jgi:prepilin-type N-terminal cleavage/methylation domain-containing protein
MVKSRKSGFTLVEIVMVLAIAGLILAVVLLALPQTERSRRDTQRKEDLSRLQTQIEFYASNHSGSYPLSITADPDFWNNGLSPVGSYVPSNFKDPSTEQNYFAVPSGTAGYLTYAVGPPATACSGSALSSTRQFVITMMLEKGTICLDNL